MDGLEFLNRGSSKGKTLEFKGKWGVLDLSVAIKKIDANPEMFMLSIVSPFFNVNKELVRKDVLNEVKKVLEFLEYE